jgi:hypothetical protein
MDAVGREELIGLLTEAPMRDAAFRPHRRHRAADVDRRRLEARICAAGLVEHLYRCGSPAGRSTARAARYNIRFLMYYPSIQVVGRNP